MGKLKQTVLDHENILNNIRKPMTESASWTDFQKTERFAKMRKMLLREEQKKKIRKRKMK